MVPGVVDAEAAADRLQHADALRHHLVADAVAGDDGDPHRVAILLPAAAIASLLLTIIGFRRPALRPCG